MDPGTLPQQRRISLWQRFTVSLLLIILTNSSVTDLTRPPEMFLFNLFSLKFSCKVSSKYISRYFVPLIVFWFVPLILKLRCLVISLFLDRNKIISVLLVFKESMLARSHWTIKSWFIYLLIFWETIRKGNLCIIYKVQIFHKMVYSIIQVIDAHQK